MSKRHRMRSRRQRQQQAAASAWATAFLATAPTVAEMARECGEQMRETATLAQGMVYALRNVLRYRA